MSITFDHVEGVVQKVSESSAPAQPSGGAAPAAKPAAEAHEDVRRRMERLAHRLHAD